MLNIKEIFERWIYLNTKVQELNKNIYKLQNFLSKEKILDFKYILDIDFDKIKTKEWYFIKENINWFLSNNKDLLEDIFRRSLIQKIKGFNEDYTQPIVNNNFRKILNYNEEEAMTWNKKLINKYIVIKSFSKKIWLDYVNVNLMLNTEINKIFLNYIVFQYSYDGKEEPEIKNIINFINETSIRYFDINNSDVIINTEIYDLIINSPIDQFIIPKRSSENRIVKWINLANDIIYNDDCVTYCGTIGISENNYSKINELDNILWKDGFEIVNDYFQNIEADFFNKIAKSNRLLDKINQLNKDDIKINENIFKEILKKSNKTFLDDKDILKMNEDFIWKLTWKYCSLRLYDLWDSYYYNVLIDYSISILDKYIFDKKYILKNKFWYKDLYSIIILLLVISLITDYILSEDSDQYNFEEWIKNIIDDIVINNIEFILEE